MSPQTDNHASTPPLDQHTVTVNYHNWRFSYAKIVRDTLMSFCDVKSILLIDNFHRQYQSLTHYTANVLLYVRCHVMYIYIHVNCASACFHFAVISTENFKGRLLWCSYCSILALDVLMNGVWQSVYDKLTRYQNRWMGLAGFWHTGYPWHIIYNYYNRFTAP